MSELEKASERLDVTSVSPETIEAELHAGHFLRKANNGGNEIYHFRAVDCPFTMQELGRLREETFRAAGGGTGKELDIDEYDTSEYPYTQLIVWNPEDKIILGGYRYIIPTPDGKYASHLATSELFRFSERFQNEYLPYTIELGRSFVRTAYQSTRDARRGMYVLDNLWDGLGALLILNPTIKYFFGKVTMYPTYNWEARNLLQIFLQKYFRDPDGLVTPIEPLDLHLDPSLEARVFTGGSYKADFEILLRELGEFGERIPPLIKSYISLSSTSRVFGTAINHEFGDVEETGILVVVNEVLPDKRSRHIDTFDPATTGKKA